MSTANNPNDAPALGDDGDGLGLRELEDQIVERMASLYPAAEEFYKLQILLDTIDGRDVFPVPDFLVGRVPASEQPDEKRRQEARNRAARRAAFAARTQRGR